MAKIEAEWFEKVDNVLYNDTSTAQLDEQIGRRVYEIGNAVECFVDRYNQFKMTVAEFTSGQEAVDQYTEHAAMISYIGKQGLLGEYFGRQETPFTNTTLNQQVNWFIQVVDGGWPHRVIYKFLSQVGDDGESWSYKMMVQKG